MKKYNFENEPFIRTYVENLDKSVHERIALAILENAKYQPIEFMENCMLPKISVYRGCDSAGFMFCNSVIASRDQFMANAEKCPEIKDELLDMWSKFEPYIPSDRQMNALSKEYMDMFYASLCWGGTWGGHGNPDYYRYLHLGTNGIRALIEECRANNPGKDYFYDACKYTMDAIDVIADRISDMAAKNAETEADEAKKAEWLRISETYKRIPREPAYDMFSATHMFWMYYTFEQHDSPGRVDEFMIDFYRMSSEEENEKCVDMFLEAMHNVRGWNVCISGSDENWNDETNELSYHILRRVKDLGYQTPNLTMRVHRNTPEKLWRLAAECIATGIGLPAIYNDEVMCPALEKCGIAPVDAHDYCMNGCNQVDIMGKSHMGLEDGEVNFAKVLELTLHNGVSLSGDAPVLLGPPLGVVEYCEDFDSFMELYYKMLRVITDYSTDASNVCQRNNAYLSPSPMRSCLIQGCLEKGKDFFEGGPLYNDGQILAEGIADACDSLYAIKKLIYDEKKYTMAELKEALRDNFVGHEELWKDFSSCDKFGNDIPEVDKLTGAVTNYWFDYLKTRKTFRGGIFTGGCSPFTRAASNGIACAALPNGKLKNENKFADSVAATPGNDVNGPTASIKSMLHYNQGNCCSGFVSQFKFDKANFNTEKGIETFISLMKTYLENGGQQVSINVLDRDTLLKALENPDDYKNLVVRVGGYSEYFNVLPPILQKNVIDRTTFDI